MPNIYLTGMMGSGKTATARVLARVLKYRFSDLDKNIEKHTGQSIAHIFESKGEAYFRGEEVRALKEASRKPGLVVATGGGVVLHAENMRVMKKTGKTVYLEASLETLWSRVKNKKNRPLLKGPAPKAVLKEIFQKRKKVYEANCDFRVPTDGRTARAVALEIARRLSPVAERK